MFHRPDGRLTAVLLAALLLTGCGICRADSHEEWEPPDPVKDLETVQERGTLVIGVTEFPPMDTRKDGTWTGFDAELSEAYAESIGVSVEFREIDWDEKTYLLDDGEIDLIWNGMTGTEELAQAITCSVPYLSNTQVIVLKDEDAAKYRDVKACSHLLFSCEEGSAAQSLLSKMRYRLETCNSQQDAVAAVKNGKTDAAVVDQIMAAYLTGGNSGLCSAYPINEEVLCVGMRKGSSLEASVNAFLQDMSQNGKLADAAKNYGLSDALLSPDA